MGTIEVLFVLLIIAFFLAVIAVAARQMATAQAKTNPAPTRDDAQLSRRLHEESLKTQQQIMSEITELKSRVGNIEKLLREVE